MRIIITQAILKFEGNRVLLNFLRFLCSTFPGSGIYVIIPDRGKTGKLND